MKRDTDYLEQAKSMISGGDPQLAVPYALIAIAESLRSTSAEQLVGAATIGAEAAVGAVSTILGVTGVGPNHTCEYDNPSMCAWPGHRR